MPLDVCIVAGEASGDLQGALLVRAMRERVGPAALRFWGAAGDAMAAEGVEPVVHSKDIAVMGFAEVLGAYDVLSKEFRTLREALEQRRPHVVILVDYPGFNLGFAERAAAMGCVVLWHVAPKTWAHGSARNETLARAADAVSALLPFEESYFHKVRVNAKFIGNPLFDTARRFLASRGFGADAASFGRIHAARDMGLIGLLPGSRASEIERILPPMLDAFFALQAESERPLRAVLPLAPTITAMRVERIVQGAAARAKKTAADVARSLKIETGGVHEALLTCGFAWVCSGTATLEAALLGTPHAVVFRMSVPTFLIARAIVKLPYFSLVNLCAEKRIANEYIQHQVTTEALMGDARRLLADEDGVRTAQQREFTFLRARFPEDSARLGADFFLDVLESSPLAPGLLPDTESDLMTSRGLPARFSAADEAMRSSVRRWRARNLERRETAVRKSPTGDTP